MINRQIYLHFTFYIFIYDFSYMNKYGNQFTVARIFLLTVHIMWSVSYYEGIQMKKHGRWTCSQIRRLTWNHWISSLHVKLLV